MTLRIARSDEPVLLNPPDEDEILILQLRRAKADKAAAEVLILELEQELIRRADARGEKTIVRGGLQATVVRRETTKIDETKLHDRLGPKWDYVTKTVFDKAKLESAVSLGIVSIDDVAECSQLVPAKPYVRVSDVAEASDT